MNTIHMLKGLPASGKTTLARQMVVDGRMKRISKDDLRAMLNFGEYSPELEVFVCEVRDAITEMAIRKGFDVVIDDTNLNPLHETALRDLASATGAQFNVEFLDTSMEECVERDKVREKRVGVEVIERMAAQYGLSL